MRYVSEARDFVGSWSAGEELAVAGPEGFFEGEETLALDEGAFDLAVVDGGVDGVADVLFHALAIHEFAISVRIASGLPS